ncbi:MAG TPA: hypothetical protein VFI47_01180 [Acidimicrobiales bacterium]|nr:hypothetical protein [Acidimicrobiales bacterium]
MRRLLSCLCAAGVLAVFVAGCTGDGDGEGAGPRATDAGDGPAGSTTTGARPAGPTAAELCSGAQPAPVAPVVAHASLTETSGIATSRTNEGVLWAHNDSGGAPEVFAVGGDDGADLGRWALQGAEATDWEDMATGPAPGGETGDREGDGAATLYLGDIGDNNAQRQEITVYRAPEPAVGARGGGTITGVEALRLSYADGPRDAETLLADPATGDLFVVSKQWDGGPTGVYRVPADADPGTPVVMARVADVAGLPIQLVTGGDVAQDGSLIVLRTYLGVLVWDRRPDETVGEALARQPCTAPAAAEPQGEAVALATDNRGYVTISEGGNPPIHWFRLP